MRYHPYMRNAIYAAWQSCMTEHIASVQCSMGYIELHITWMQCTLYGNTLRQPAILWCNMVRNAFMQEVGQCIVAIYQRVHCHVVKQKNKSRQIWNKLYTLNSSLWRESLYLSLWATRKAVWENPRSPCCSPVISITWTDITYLWWIVIIHSTASVPYGARKWETLKETCISGVCCADSSTGRARRRILSLPVFRARNWRRHFHWQAGVTILFFDLSGTVNSPDNVLDEMVRIGTRNSRWHVERWEWQTKRHGNLFVPPMECDKKKWASGGSMPGRTDRKSVV